MQKSKCDSRLVFPQAYMWLRNRLAVSRYWTQRSKSNFSSTCGKVYWASSTKPFNILKFVCTPPCLHVRLCKFQQCIFFSLTIFLFELCTEAYGYCIVFSFDLRKLSSTRPMNYIFLFTCILYSVNYCIPEDWSNCFT